MNSSIYCIAIIIFGQILFFTGKLRSDLVGLIALLSLYLSGIISSKEAISGFSDPAFITVAAMFIISAALSSSGVATTISKFITEIGKGSYPKLLFVILMISTFLSAFMNNVAVTALMLPIVMEVAKVSLISPSLFLIPMAFAVLLGGTTTLIGTPPNLLVSSIMQSQGLPGLSFFSFTPVGLACCFTGVLYLYFFSRKFLVAKRPTNTISLTPNVKIQELNKNNYSISINDKSDLVDCSLINSRLGIALGLTILSIQRNNEFLINPDSYVKLKIGDKLLAHGDQEFFVELETWKKFDYNLITAKDFIESGFSLQEFKIPLDSKLIGKKLFEVSFSETFGIKVLSILRDNKLNKRISGSTVIEANDSLLLYGHPTGMDLLIKTNQFEHHDVEVRKLVSKYRLNKRIFSVNIPTDSGLIGKSVKEMKLAKRFNLRALVIKRDGEYFIANSFSLIHAGDQLIIFGRKSELKILNALQTLDIQLVNKDLASLVETSNHVLTEVTVYENSTLIGLQIREAKFRERYQAQVIGVWRGDKLISSNLAKLRLLGGDNLILLTTREQIARLSTSTQLLLLSERNSLKPDPKKVFLASFAIFAMVFGIIFKVVDVEIAGIITVVFLILTKCISHEKAYMAIDLKSLILIATTIPYGIAMNNSGAAEYLGQIIIEMTQSHGKIYMLATLYLITMVSTLAIPNQAVVLIIAPIGLSVAQVANLDINSTMVAIAVASSSSFFSPISHASNLLVMGAGNYSFKDYFKLGFGLAIIIMITCLLAVSYSN